MNFDALLESGNGLHVVAALFVDPAKFIVYPRRIRGQRQGLLQQLFRFIRFSLLHQSQCFADCAVMIRSGRMLDMRLILCSRPCRCRSDCGGNSETKEQYPEEPNHLFFTILSRSYLNS